MDIIPVKASPELITLHKRIIFDIIKGNNTPDNILDSFNTKALKLISEKNKVQISEVIDYLDTNNAFIAVINGQLSIIKEDKFQDKSEKYFSIIKTVITIAIIILLGVAISLLINIFFLN